MGNWKDILDEIQSASAVHDVIRRKYLKKFQEQTGRNVIAYYSGWLQKQAEPWIVGINDNDKNGFMSTIKGLDREKGLDLILHTPGGDIAATESLVDYLRSWFGTNIRAIVPQLAMSAGTLISCAANQIVMGKHSSLGPIDPQMGGIPAHGVIEEFNRACEEIKQDPAKIPVWQPIIAKYHPTFIGECQKVIKWSEYLARNWLATGMLKDKPDGKAREEKIFAELGSHSSTLSHARHFNAQHCRDLGLEILMLEDDQPLQDALLPVHHAFIHTLSSTPAIKIIENHLGSAFVQIVQNVAVMQTQPIIQKK